MMKRSIVVGGAGALGRALIRDLKLGNFAPISVDFARNDDASDNIVLDKSSLLKDQWKTIINQLSAKYETNKFNLQGVFCAAGGWAGGSIDDDSIFDSVLQMNQMNLESALLSTHISSKLLTNSGLLVLTGAEAAIRPTPGMLAYGLSKVSTHFLTQSAAIDPSFINKKATVLALLPCTIDTPTNRTYMADANFSNWTKVLFNYHFIIIYGFYFVCLIFIARIYIIIMFAIYAR